MRVLVGILVLACPFAASADVRVGVHAAGGLEGILLRDPHPEAVVEAGLTAECRWPGKRWGLAAGFERIGRGYDDLSNEWKLDAGFGVSNTARTSHLLVGVGIRTVTLAGDERRLPATIHGFDLLRLAGQIQIARRGAISLDFYLGWTFGVYKGRQYDEQLGDMVQTSRQVTALTTTYVLGLQTSFTLK